MSLVKTLYDYDPSAFRATESIDHALLSWLQLTIAINSGLFILIMFWKSESEDNGGISMNERVLSTCGIHDAPCTHGDYWWVRWIQSKHRRKRVLLLTCTDWQSEKWQAQQTKHYLKNIASYEMTIIKWERRQIWYFRILFSCLSVNIR